MTMSQLDRDSKLIEGPQLLLISNRINNAGTENSSVLLLLFLV